MKSRTVCSSWFWITLMKSAGILISLAVFLLLESCQGGTALDDKAHIHGDGVRNTWVEGYLLGDGAYIPGGLQGTVQMKIGVVVSMGFSSSMGDGLQSMETVASKVEVDFGDGSGWQDVTEDFRTKYDFELFPYEYSEDTLTVHTYTEPGDYIIVGRTTYWDGQVVLSHPVGHEVFVRVLAPEAQN